eukprot:jgi/Mesvir1/5498/Mv15542-RA.2
MGSFAAFGKENIFSDDEESIHWDHSMSRDFNNSLDLSIEFPTDVSLFAKHHATTSTTPVLAAQNENSGIVQRPVFSTPPARYSRHSDQRVGGKEHHSWTERAKMGKALLNWGVMEVDGDRPRRPFGRVNTQGGSLTASPAASGEFVKPNFARSLQFERGEAAGALAPPPAVCQASAASVHASPRQASLSSQGAHDSPRTMESRKRISSLEAQQAALLAHNAALLEEMEDVEIRSVVAVMVAKAICAVERSCARSAQEHAAATEKKPAPSETAKASPSVATSAPEPAVPASTAPATGTTTTINVTHNTSSPQRAPHELSTSASKPPVGSTGPRPRTTEKKPKGQGALTPGSPCGPFSPLPKKRRHSVVFGAVSARGRMTFSNTTGGSASASIARRACQCGLSGGSVDASMSSQSKSFSEHVEGVPTSASMDASAGGSLSRRKSQLDGLPSNVDAPPIMASLDASAISKSSGHHHHSGHHHSHSHYVGGTSTKQSSDASTSMTNGSILSMPPVTVVRSSAASVGFLVPPMAQRKVASAEKKLKEAEKRVAAAKAAAAKKEADLMLRVGTAMHERDAARVKAKALEDELAALKVKASDLTGALEFAQQQLEEQQQKQEQEEQAQASCDNAEWGMSTPGPTVAAAKATPTALSRMEATRLQYEAARARNQELEAVMSAMAHRHAAEVDELKELLAEADAAEQERRHCRSLGLPTREEAVHTLVTNILSQVILSCKDDEIVAARAEKKALQAAWDADVASRLASATALQAQIDQLQEELRSRDASIAELRRTSNIMLGTIASGASITGSVARSSLGGVARSSLGGVGDRNSFGGARLSLMLATPRLSLAPTPRSSYGGNGSVGRTSIGEEEEASWEGGEVTLGDAAAAVVASLESCNLASGADSATGKNTADAKLDTCHYHNDKTAVSHDADDTVDLGAGIDGSKGGDADVTALGLGSILGGAGGRMLDMHEVSLEMSDMTLDLAGGVDLSLDMQGGDEVAVQLPPLQLEKLHAELGRLSTLVVTLEGEQRAREAEAERVIMRMESAEEGRRATQARADALAEDLRRATVELDRMRAQLEGAESARSSAEARAEEAEASVSSLRGDMRRVEGEAEKVLWALAQAQAEREHASKLAEQVSSLEEQLATSRAQYAQTSTDYQSQVDALMATEAGLRDELAAAAEALAVATASAEDTMSALRGSISQLEADKAEQSQLLASAHASLCEATARAAAAEDSAAAARSALDAATAKVAALEAESLAVSTELEQMQVSISRVVADKESVKLEAEGKLREAQEAAAAEVAELMSRLEELQAAHERQQEQDEQVLAHALEEQEQKLLIQAEEDAARLRQEAAVRMEAVKVEWEARCAQLEEDVDVLRYQLGKGKEEHAGVLRQVAEEQAGLVSKLDQVEREAAALGGQVGALEKEKSGLLRQVDASRDEIESLKAELEDEGKKVECLEMGVERLEKEKACLEQERERLEEEARQAKRDGRKMAAELGDKVAAAERELAASRELLACAGDELKALQEGRERATQELARERQKRTAVNARAVHLEATLALLTDERGRLAVEASRATDAAAQTALHHRSSEARRSLLEGQLGDAQAEVARMAGELAALRAAAESHARDILLSRGELDTMAVYVEDLLASKHAAEAVSRQLAEQLAEAKDQLLAVQADADDAVNLRLILAEAEARDQATTRESGELREAVAAAQATAEELATVQGLLASAEEAAAEAQGQLAEARKEAAEARAQLVEAREEAAAAKEAAIVAQEKVAAAQEEAEAAKEGMAKAREEAEAAREEVCASQAELIDTQALAEVITEEQEERAFVMVQLAAVTAERDAALASLVGAREMLASVMAERDTHEEALSGAESRLVEAEDKVAEAEEKWTEAQNRLVKAGIDATEAEGKLAEAERALAGVRGELEEANKKLAALTAEAEEAWSMLASATADQCRIASLTTELEGKQASIASATEQVAALTADLANVTASLQAELASKEATLASGTEQVEGLRTELANKEASLQGLQADLAAKTAEMGLKEASMAFLTEQLASVTAAWQAATENLASATARVGALEAELEGERDVRQVVAAQVEQLGEYGSDLEAQHAALVAREHELMAELEMLRDSAKRDEDDAGLRLEELATVVMSLQARLAVSESELASSAAELAAKHAEVSAVQAELAAARDEISAAQSELLAARDELSNLRDERDELLATASREQAQAAASEAQRRMLAMSGSPGMSSALLSPRSCGNSPSVMSLDGCDVDSSGARVSSPLSSMAYASGPEGIERAPSGEDCLQRALREHVNAGQREGQQREEGPREVGEDEQVHAACHDALCSAVSSHLVRMAVATVVMRAEVDTVRAEADRAVARAERQCKRRADECEALRLEVKAAKQSYLELSEFCELEQSIAAERGNETDAVISQLRADLAEVQAELQRAQDTTSSDPTRSSSDIQSLVAEALLAANVRHAAALETLRSEHSTALAHASSSHAHALQEANTLVSRLQEELSDANSKYVALVAEHSALTAQLDETKAALAAATQDLASATERLAVTSEKLTSTNEKLTSAKRASESSDEKLATVTATLANVTAKADGLEEERAKLEGERDRLMAALDAVTQSKSTLVEKLVGMDGAMGRMREEVAAARRERQRAVEAATEQLGQEVKSLEAALSDARQRIKKALAERDAAVTALEEETETRDAAVRGAKNELGAQLQAQGAQLAAALKVAEGLRAELARRGEEYEGLMLRAREAEVAVGERDAMRKECDEAKQMAAKMQRHIVELRNAHGSALAEIQRLTDKSKVTGERMQILISNLQKAESEVEAIDKEKEALQRLLRMLQHGLLRHAHFIAPCAELVNMVKAVNDGLKAVEAAEAAQRA